MKTIVEIPKTMNVLNLHEFGDLRLEKKEKSVAYEYFSDDNLFLHPFNIYPQI